MSVVLAVRLIEAFARLHPEALFFWVFFHGLLFMQLLLKADLTPSAFLAGQLGLAFVFTQGASRSLSFDFVRKAGGGAALWRALAASWLLSLHLPSLAFYFFVSGASKESVGISFIIAEGMVIAFFTAAVVPFPTWSYLPLLVSFVVGYSLIN